MKPSACRVWMKLNRIGQDLIDETLRLYGVDEAEAHRAGSNRWYPLPLGCG
jgi:hypothetical protein